MLVLHLVSFYEKKTKFPDGVVGRGFLSPMGAQEGFRAQIGDFLGHLARAPRDPWPILPPCAYMPSQGTSHWHCPPLGTTCGLVTGLKRG